MILLVNENGKEMIVMGKGIGFNKHNSSEVDFSKVDKKFILEEELSDRFLKLINEIPPEHFEIANQIIDYAEKKLAVNLNNSIYIALTDHISFAISRAKDGLNIKNVLLWEIKKFYQREFEVAVTALQIIKNNTGVELLEDEAGSIALHLVNAQQNEDDIKMTIEIVKIVNDLTNVIKYHYGIELDESSLNYSRFMTHLRYFAYRVLKEEFIAEEENSLFEQIKSKYPAEFSCAKKIVNYLEKNYQITPTQEELVYFMIHIHRVTARV